MCWACVSPRPCNKTRSGTFFFPTCFGVNSVKRVPGELELEFTLTDLNEELVVLYSGILPDLFREGQGIIAHGRLNDDGDFVADTVLAKHDENYMPPEVADSLARHAPDKAADAEQ